MIWYILYPFRGTTEPPRLSPTHPIRRAFEAYGTTTARHWRLSILLTIVVSVLLCYPALFQTDSPAAAGLRNLPKHVWTSTTELEGERPADVEVRQVWVHGDYMKAIDARVLRQALTVQNVLIGQGFSEELSDSPPDSVEVSAPVKNGCYETSSGLNWGYHSPLMYWDCSMTAIENDSDLLATINSKTSQHTSLNLTLRPSTVFAGKAFSNKKLRAADALVITLFDQTKSSLGHSWNERSRQLAQDISPEWSLFPQDGQVVRSHLYEFRFKPMTLNDDLFLALSYLITAVYVISRMMQLRAVKSWFGLLITICAKMTICVIASFTVCAFLGIDLGRIPRPWFPGVVFCFGLGNIFRLINVVLETPPEMPPVQRIGNAIGEVGHLSLAVAGQNLVLVYLCSRVVTPMVADFCVFAAVTLVFDFVFHLTFFLAVLSVDVQRMELQDSLERVDLTQVSATKRPERQSWLAALRQGKTPFSTRFAGSAAIFSIILAINWHFFDGEGRRITARGVLNRLRTRTTKRSNATMWSPPPINQARSPADWLRLQDHNTAKELFGFIKPNANSFIARVYDPLLVVLNGANGRDVSQKRSSWLESVRHFARDHAFPAALMVVFLIAGVTLLMNYLLWNGLPAAVEEGDEDEEAHFSVRSLLLPNPQSQDVVRLASCPKGHIVSVDLHKCTTSLWLNDHGRGYTTAVLDTTSIQEDSLTIVACAMDDGGKSLAICTKGGQIALFSLASARFLWSLAVELVAQVPVLFSFIPSNGMESPTSRIIIVTPDGDLTMVDATTGVQHNKRISSCNISAASLYTCAKDDASLVYVTRAGEVSILSLKEDRQWNSEVVAGLDPGPPPGSNPAKIKSIHSASSLGLIFAIRTDEVELFDFHSRALIHTLQIGPVKPHTFRVMHSARRHCSCGAFAVHSLTIAYTEQDTTNMIMHTYTLGTTSTSQLCLGKASDNESNRCKGLQHATESVYRVDSAGVWESTDALSIIGIRRSALSPSPLSSASGIDGGYYTVEPNTLTSALKLRATREGRPNNIFSINSTVGTRYPPASPTDNDAWEAWTLSSTGEFKSRPLVSEDDGPFLLVTTPGPMVRLGKRSVAVGYGNTVKIITLGKETFDGMVGSEDGALDMSVGSYKWRIKRGNGRKTQ